MALQPMPMVQWAVVLHDGSWKIYDSAVAHLLEQGFANHNQHVATGFAALSGTFNLPSGNYQVDFSTMEQINTRTGVRRQVGRAEHACFTLRCASLHDK